MRGTQHNDPRKEGQLPKVLIQVAFSLFFDHAFHGAQQHAQFDLDVHGVGFDLDVAIGTTAIELQRVVFPVRVYTQAVFKLFGHFFNGATSLLKAE